MNNSILKSLTSSFTYTEYRNHVTQLLKENMATGHEQSEALVHYSSLNEARMNRLEKTIKITEENIQKLQKIENEYLWLVISEGWCGDAAQILPIIHKMEETTSKIDLKIILRDDHDEVMQLFLTNGSKSIPKLIVIDKTTNEVVGDFGPRPTGAKQLIIDYKEKHGVVDETAKTELQLWYLHDKGIATQNEIMDLF